MNMKKILTLLLCAFFSLNLCSLSVFAKVQVKMYAPDGRTIVVWDNEVNAYKKVGWFDNINYAKATMYAPDGRTLKIWKSEVEAYKNVGWYEYPVTKMSAPDGRTIVVSTSSVKSWQNVGWRIATPAEYFLGYTREWISYYLGDNLTWEYNYDGGTFFKSKNSNLAFGFGIYGDTTCSTVIGNLKDVFPDLANKADKNGYVSRWEVSKFFNYTYDYSYDEVNHLYVGHAIWHSPSTQRKHMVVLCPEYDGRVNIYYGVELLNKSDGHS